MPGTRLRLGFYVKSAFRSLQRERRRSLFAIFAIAAGVAAIVGLQSLGLSIDDSITGDIKATHQGDVVVTSRNDNPFRPEQRATLDALASDGRFADWSYFYWVNPDRPSFVRSASDTVSQTQRWLQPYLIEGDKYPFYRELRSIRPRGIPVSQLLESSGDIVLSESIAGNLSVGIGDKIVLENTDTFTVTGIVSNEASGGPFAPYFVPPLPWFGFLEISGPLARKVFAVDDLDANVLFIKTESNRDAADLARELRIVRGSTPASGQPAGVFEPVFRRDQVETASEALDETADATGLIERLLLVSGLVSLAIGGIGILNTMIVVVGRRTNEVGVLKALGLKGRQITLLFMIEGLVLGIAGSVIGVLLGIALSAGLIGFSEQFLLADIDWALHVEPIYTGLVVGIVVTTVFGFLPTLAAAKVRPSAVLQPQVSTRPKTGRLQSLITLLFLTAVMGLVTSIFLNDLLFGMIGAFGALLVLAFLTLLLLGVVSVIGRAPDWNSINLKLALRGLSRQKGRAASTLLALVVGLLAIGSVVILSGSLKQLVDELVEEEAGGNVLTFLTQPTADIRDRAVDEISSMENVVSVESRVYPVNMEDPDNQGRFFGNTLISRTAGPAGSGFSTSDTLVILSGRDLRPEDEGQPVVVMHVPPWMTAEPEVGDDLSFVFSGKFVDGKFVGERVVLKLVGITSEFPAQGGFEEGMWLAPLGVIPQAIPPASIFFVVAAPPSEAPAVAAQLNRNVPGAIAIEVDTVASVFREILDRVSVFPTILSGLALFAGAIIIANSVALATMERRREIALMKSVGAKGTRVLTALLLENGLLGLTGGAIGVALSVVVLVILNQLDSDIPVSPEPLPIIGLLALAVGISLGAALLSAWPASREKPLSVLRHE